MLMQVLFTLKMCFFQITPTFVVDCHVSGYHALWLHHSASNQLSNILALRILHLHFIIYCTCNMYVNQCNNTVCRRKLKNKEEQHYYKLNQHHPNSSINQNPNKKNNIFPQPLTPGSIL